MAPLVYLATLVRVVALVAKVHREKLMLIPELQEPKACKEIQVSQVAVAMTEHPVTVVFQEDLVSLDRRELLVKQDGLE